MMTITVRSLLGTKQMGLLYHWPGLHVEERPIGGCVHSPRHWLYRFSGVFASLTKSSNTKTHTKDAAARAEAGTLRIMVVEDEAIVALDMARTIRRFGHFVIGPAASGAEAIHLAHTERPDLVLMDIRLKGSMDGVEAAVIIRRELAIPIVYVTGQADTATVQRAKKTEPAGYLNKPFTASELADMIRQVIDKP
jgi:CheY-like chemotaxis protein